eukprot:TRINITY_DN47211_c0_g1_i1.p1 TRINITY_DN47211_c0_g1~~TRINITY_DN47211_c0_g1_i1.p1  ORF type:complete len:178 (-),score=27.66 TRINITY_DN47211_c0_g1_i1:59-592(-)
MKGAIFCCLLVVALANPTPPKSFTSGIDIDGKSVLNGTIAERATPKGVCDQVMCDKKLGECTLYVNGSLYEYNTFAKKCAHRKDKIPDCISELWKLIPFAKDTGKKCSHNHTAPVPGDKYQVHGGPVDADFCLDANGTPIAVSIKGHGHTHSAQRIFFSNFKAATPPASAFAVPSYC